MELTELALLLSNLHWNLSPNHNGTEWNSVRGSSVRFHHGSVVTSDGTY
jgi:hypothetical protein